LPNIKPKLAKSYFDLIIHLDCPPDECLRRAADRLIDPNTQILYHMTDSPPNPDDKKLNERLQVVTEPS